MGWLCEPPSSHFSRGGRALLQPEAVTGPGSLADRLVGQIVHAVFREDFEEELRAKNAGVEMALVRLDVGLQRRDDARVLIGGDAHFQSEDVAAGFAVGCLGLSRRIS